MILMVRVIVSPDGQELAKSESEVLRRRRIVLSWERKNERSSCNQQRRLAHRLAKTLPAPPTTCSIMSRSPPFLEVDQTSKIKEPSELYNYNQVDSFSQYSSPSAFGRTFVYPDMEAPRSVYVRYLENICYFQRVAISGIFFDPKIDHQFCPK